MSTSLVELVKYIYKVASLAPKISQFYGNISKVTLIKPCSMQHLKLLVERPRILLKLPWHYAEYKNTIDHHCTWLGIGVSIDLHETAAKK